jgi:hypothetical protein
MAKPNEMDIDPPSKRKSVAWKIIAAVMTLFLGLAALAATVCGVAIWGHTSNKGQVFADTLLLFLAAAFILWLAYLVFSRGVIGKSKSAAPLPHENDLQLPPIDPTPDAPHLIEDLTGVDKSELGTCPNCSGVIRLRSAECMHCRAAFGETSAWKIEPLVK